MANKQFTGLNNVVNNLAMHLSIIRNIYECVDPRCEKLTKCLQGVNSLNNTTFV